MQSIPEYAAEVPEPAVAYLAQQVKVDATLFAKSDFLSRAAKHHRTQIREELGSRECTKAYQVELGRSLSGVIRTIETLTEASVLRSLREGSDCSTATGRMLAPAVRPTDSRSGAPSRALRGGGKSIASLITSYGVSRATIYRALTNPTRIRLPWIPATHLVYLSLASVGGHPVLRELAPT